VAQVLLGVRSEARRVRFVPRALPAAFPHLPGQSGYNKRLEGALPLTERLIRVLARDTGPLATPAGLPITWTPADPKLDERQMLIAALDHDRPLTAAGPG
jgi:hypothetical protein